MNYQTAYDNIYRDHCYWKCKGKCIGDECAYHVALVMLQEKIKEESEQYIGSKEK